MAIPGHIYQKKVITLQTTSSTSTASDTITIKGELTGIRAATSGTNKANFYVKDPLGRSLTGTALTSTTATANNQSAMTSTEVFVNDTLTVSTSTAGQKKTHYVYVYWKQ
jgi:hypothetical protein